MEKTSRHPALKVDLTVNGQIELFPAALPGPASSGRIASLTNNQKALTAYYGLKVCGVKPRDTADVATMARFMHLVLGIPYTSIDCSTLYKRLQSVPDLTNPSSAVSLHHLLHLSLPQMKHQGQHLVLVLQ